MGGQSPGELDEENAEVVFDLDAEPIEVDEDENIDLDLGDGGFAFPAVSSNRPVGLVELRPQRVDINERLDRYLARHVPELSRSYLQQLIADGKIQVDGVVRRPAFKLTPGEVVTLDVPPPVVDTIVPESIPLDIVYEDDDVIVLNKAPGMVVHPAPGHTSGTLVNALLHYAPDMSVSGTLRPGIVHRLDKDTSGLMVVAKNDQARNSLAAQWEARTVSKAYVALAHGLLEDDEATVDAPIGRDPALRQKMAVVPSGRDAISHVKVLERFPKANAQLLSVRIETGRTHQIRVHLAFVGHPIIGDGVYGRSRGVAKRGEVFFRRQFLHAAELAFNLPDGRPISFASELPSDLERPLRRLREAESGEEER